MTAMSDEHLWYHNVESECCIFMDANAALHFMRADQIDWCAVANVPSVVLIVAPVYLRELEEQKVTNKSSKLRQRAAETTRWLAKLMDDVEPILRQGVSIRFLGHEPLIDFTEHRLSERVYDDHLIASVIEFSQSGYAKDVRVATADTGLKAKLRSRHIGILWLPDSVKLPEEPDPLEKENAQLRRENARLIARIPQLKLLFADRQNIHSVALQRPSEGAVATLDQIRSRHPKRSAPKAEWHGGRGAMPMFEATPAQINEYNEKLDSFYSAWARYQQELERWADQRTLHFTVELLLINEGLAKATDIDAELTLPENVVACEAEDLAEPPKEPKPPRPPSPFPDFAGSLENGGALLSHLIPRSPTLARISRGEPELIIRRIQEITFRAHDLKHHHSLQLPSLTVSEFLTSTLSRDCRDAARAARQHCHESSAQSPPNGGNRIRNVPFRPQWRTPSGGKLREL